MPSKRSILALVIALAMTVAACGGGAAGDGGEADPDSFDLSASGSAGLTVFQSKCAACHGAELGGGSGPALGLASAAAGKPLDDLRRVITEGGRGMPSWGGLLSAQEIDDLMTLLAEAQGR